MSINLSHEQSRAALLRTDMPVRMAKADIRKTDKELSWQDLGWVIAFVQYSCGLTLDEFAASLATDPRQIKRQQDAEDRPQIEKVWAVARYKRHVVIGMSLRAGDGVDAVTTISVERSA